MTSSSQNIEQIPSNIPREAPPAPSEKRAEPTPVPSPSAQRSDTLRLRLLRAHDTQRTWASLHETRVCLLCEREFTGLEIRIRMNAGKPVFLCPSAMCRGRLPHFVHPGNPLLDETAWADWMDAHGTGHTHEQA